jgi:heme exporter protein A
MNFVQLIVENLVQSRGGRRVIDGLSFRVPAGDALILRGPNGAGKTTLLRTLAGFIRPEHGSIRLESGPPEAVVSELCHFVGHLNGIKSNLTVAENLTFLGRILLNRSGDGGEERLGKALDAFHLSALAHIPAGYLSAGQKRRTALARLLMADRPLWLLDEPTSSLDTESSNLLVQAANTHTQAGGLIVAATHLPLPFEKAAELTLVPVMERA